MSDSAKNHSKDRNKNQPQVGAGTTHTQPISERKSTPPTSQPSSDKQNFAQELLQLRSLRIAKRKAHRKALRDGLVRTCEIGEALSNSSSAWKNFIAADWGKLRPPKEGERSDAIRWAIKFWVGEGKGNDKKASFYFRAVGPLWQRTPSAQKVRAEIKRVGLRGLHDMHAAKKNDTNAIACIAKGSPSPKPAMGLVWMFEARFAEVPEKLLRAPVGQEIKLTGRIEKLGAQTTVTVQSWKLK
ncbi:hypothetical protein [Rhizobium leguminosarum]|jgi:hypothetical protein|uniref:hypothetical protein n=1 Tax=Rhizobium leguminosarum TaxID=384 RepID=UPI0010321951|nr:hypothetical protein [Rhizobium leguminosarum]TAX37041.1 hypothetical protein ELI06_23210 [Rhizobium leguminosarum]